VLFVFIALTHERRRIMHFHDARRRDG
jgi:hypothetical protein